ncbi:MAG: sulfotransferase domain-containing protein [Anaerolineae bacterium]|nr:sulfotransferase domain-containing protein [Anaerolineae bacterium]
MTLPGFLGIGEEKCGTTWLDALLASHPDIFIPTLATEIHFFDRYYARGLQWYEKFFPSETQASRYQAIGEITPSYLHCALCPQRIVSTPQIAKFIVMLRNPIDRAYSHYWHRVRIDRYPGSFRNFLADRPEAIQWGFYSKSLKNYLGSFPREQILVLIFEQATANVSETKQSLAQFLNVSVDRFPQMAGAKKVNKGHIPRFPSVYTGAVYGARRLRDLNLDWLVRLVKRIGFQRIFDNSASSLPPMEKETRQYLVGVYKDEMKELERLLQQNLASYWG